MYQTLSDDFLAVEVGGITKNFYFLNYVFFFSCGACLIF